MADESDARTQSSSPSRSETVPIRRWIAIGGAVLLAAIGYALTKNPQWFSLVAVGLVIAVVVAFVANVANAIRREAP